MARCGRLHNGSWTRCIEPNLTIRTESPRHRGDSWKPVPSILIIGPLLVESDGPSPLLLKPCTDRI